MSESAKILETLFRPNDRVYVCGTLQTDNAGTRYTVPQVSQASKLSSIITAEHRQFCINPLTIENKNEKGAKSIRAAVNVAAYRNFLLESDTLPLQLQYDLLPTICQKFPITAVIYSGGKSLHYIISLQDDLKCGQPGSDKANDMYKMYWKGLEQALTAEIRSAVPGTNNAFDSSTKDVIKLARIPEAMRGSVKQKLVYQGRLASSDEIYELGSKVERANYGLVNAADPSMSLEALEYKLAYAPDLSIKKFRTKVENAVSWAAPAGMYHELFKLALWAHDSIGVPYKTLDLYFQRNLYSIIKAKGYPRDPSTGVFNAYKWKGLIL
jgi:hypothetical protein